jgi:hypothetical protein
MAYMQGQRLERFKELCEHAEVIDDPKELAAIASEINKILKIEVQELKRRPLHVVCYLEPRRPGQDGQSKPERHSVIPFPLSAECFRNK